VTLAHSFVTQFLVNTGDLTALSAAVSSVEMIASKEKIASDGEALDLEDAAAHHLSNQNQGEPKEEEQAAYIGYTNLNPNPHFAEAVFDEAIRFFTTLALQGEFYF
jgi:hypothetical protein